MVLEFICFHLMFFRFDSDQFLASELVSEKLVVPFFSFLTFLVFVWIFAFFSFNFCAFHNVWEIFWNINFTECGAKRAGKSPRSQVGESLWLFPAIKLTTLGDSLEVRGSRILPGSSPCYCKSFQLQWPWSTTTTIYDYGASRSERGY